MAKGEFWILALSGGGARGLFTASILDQMEHGLGASIANHFDLIAGTSIGGILALGVAKEIPAPELLGLFEHSREIFDRASILPWPLFKAKYRNKALKAYLERVFGNTVIGDLKHRIVIPAINYTKGSPSFFKTPHDSSLRRDWEYRLVDVGMATSAAPTFFPIYGFANQHFVDGGLVANAPGLIAVHEALHFAGHPDVNSIHVVSVGTAGGGTAMDPGLNLDMGTLVACRRRGLGVRKGWGFRIFDLTVRSQEAMSNSMLSHWLTDRHHLIDASPQRQQSDYLELDDVSEEARSALLGQAAVAGQNLLTTELMAQIRAHQPLTPQFYYGPNKNVSDRE